MMKVEYIKEGKGHNILIDGKWRAWVIGSIETAKKYYNKHFKGK